MVELDSIMKTTIRGAAFKAEKPNPPWVSGGLSPTALLLGCSERREALSNLLKRYRMPAECHKNTVPASSIPGYYMALHSSACLTLYRIRACCKRCQPHVGGRRSELLPMSADSQSVHLVYAKTPQETEASPGTDKPYYYGR